MTAQNTARQIEAQENGVHVDRLMSVIGSIQDDPENAKFQFRQNTKWIDGGLHRSSNKGFFANGAEDDTRTQTFTVDSDQPYLVGGQGSAPTPVEHLLNSLGSCLSVTMVYHAAAQGIAIDSVETAVEGEMDVRGFFGLSEDVRKGFKAISVRMRVRSDADAETLSKLAMYSPVYDVVANSVPVDFKLEKI